MDRPNTMAPRGRRSSRLAGTTLKRTFRRPTRRRMLTTPSGTPKGRRPKWSTSSPSRGTRAWAPTQPEPEVPSRSMSVTTTPAPPPSNSAQTRWPSGWCPQCRAPPAGGARHCGYQPEGHRVYADLLGGGAGVVVTDMDRDGTSGSGCVGAQARVPLDGLLVDHFGRRPLGVPDGVVSIRRRVGRRNVRFNVVPARRELRRPRGAIVFGRSIGESPVRKPLQTGRSPGPPVGHVTGEDEA